MITPGEIRAKANRFDTGLRGFDKPEVLAYLARLELAVVVLADEPGSAPELPPGIRPAEIRKQDFTVVWRGVDTDQVRACLNEIATHIEKRLSEPLTALAPTIEFGANFRARQRDGHASGLLRGAEIVTSSGRRSITFCTPEGLTRDLAARLAHAETCLVSDMIVVSAITVDAMNSAVETLASAGEL